MAFVNEYVSEKDIDDFNLRRIWDKYCPLYRGEYFHGRTPDWTIDHANGNFLWRISFGQPEEPSLSNFLLSVGGNEIRFGVTTLDTSSQVWSDNPFRMDYELAYLDVPEKLGLSKQKIVELIKEALDAFGYMGARKQVPNTRVTLKT